MLGLGIGAGRAPRSGRAPAAGPAGTITAAVVPASSVLTAGQTLAETRDWAVFLDPSNYSTTAPGQTVSAVSAGYPGGTASATEPLADGDINAFTVTVIDTGGTVRVFTVQPRVVLEAAPATTGSLADRSLTRGTGTVLYDVSGGFTGAGLSYSVPPLAGVSLDGATGVIRFDTDVLQPQSGTVLEVTATNSGGSATGTFSLDVVAPAVYGAAISGLTGSVARIGVALTGTVSNLQGGETVTHRWQDNSGLIAGAQSAVYTPVPSQDLRTLQYVPLVDGQLVASAGYTVRHAPPVAGTLLPVTGVAGSGTPTVNLDAGFTGQALVYTTTAGGVSISGGTLTIADVPRDEVLTITATNSGGQADTALAVTLTAALTVPGTMAAPALAVNGPDAVTVTLAADPADGGTPVTGRDLRWRESGGSWTVVSGVTSPYTLTGLTAATDHEVQTRARNAVGPGGWSATAAAATDAALTVPGTMAAPALAVNGPDAVTVTLAADPVDGGTPVTGRDLRWRESGGSWTVVSGVTNPYTLTGLTAATDHEVQTRARNAVGPGGWSATAAAATDTAPPEVFTAIRNGTDLVLGNVPDISPQTFTATVDGPDLNITFTGTQVTPAPERILVVDAGAHDGANPGPGAYDVRIFDLGTPRDGVHTLSGAGVSDGALVTLIAPETAVVTGGEETFGRVVFVGASIMSQTFGTDFSQRNTAVETLFGARGASVEVYANAVSNSDLADVAVLLAEAMAAYPSDTLFFVHAGGNDVSRARPFPGNAAAVTADLDALIDVAATRPGSVILSDLTFRDYGDTTAFDEAAGSKPYNDTIYLPAFQARKADLLERAYYADGTAVSCLYEWSYYNREAYLGADNVHPANPGGRVLLREWLAGRLAPLCAGQSLPPQEDRASLAPAATGVDLFIEYGANNTVGVNTPDFVTAFDNAGDTSDGPFDLLNADTSDPGVTLQLNFSAPSPGNSGGFGLNLSGRSVGAADFDGTLYNDVFTTDSYFAGSAYTVDHVLSGLAPGTDYTVALVASRGASGSRETLYTFSNGETATIESTASPVEAPVTVLTRSDATGTITITQSANTGSWSYLSGLHIFDT